MPEPVFPPLLSLNVTPLKTAVGVEVYINHMKKEM